MFGQRRSEASDATTEIERWSVLVRDESPRFEMAQDRVNFLPASGEELLRTPLAAMPGRISADGPKRVCSGKTLPVSL